jgi:hypothetical protein
MVGHSPRRWRRAWLTGWIVAALAAPGCASRTPRQDGPGPPAARPVPILLDSADLRLPAQDYLLTGAQAALVGRGRLLLIQRCMRRFGVSYAVPEVGAGRYGPRTLTDRRYGITDAALAARDGYRLGARDPALQKRPAVPRLGPDAQTALTGDGRSRIHGLAVPDGGCIAEADRHLAALAPREADPVLGERLQLGSFEASRQDERVRRVFRAWSSCMRRAGYDYADPLTVVGDPQFAGNRPGPHEISVAYTDVLCKASTNVIGIWFTVESAYQQGWIQQHAAAMLSCKNALAAEIRAAAALVNGK